MTNLTEQWKKGKIPEAWYYVKDIHNKESLDRYFKETDNFEYLEDWEVDEVLAPVPSYEKWIMTKNLSERAHSEMYKARGEKVKLEKENTKLKELLKECQGYFEAYKRGEKYVEQRGEFYNIWELALKRIDQVLGEAICREKSNFDEKEYYKALFGEQIDEQDTISEKCPANEFARHR